MLEQLSMSPTVTPQRLHLRPAWFRHHVIRIAPLDDKFPCNDSNQCQNYAKMMLRTYKKKQKVKRGNI